MSGDYISSELVRKSLEPVRKGLEINLDKPIEGDLLPSSYLLQLQGGFQGELARPSYQVALEEECAKEYEYLLKATVFGIKSRALFMSLTSDYVGRYIQQQEQKIMQFEESASDDGYNIQTRVNMDLYAKFLFMRVQRDVLIIEESHR